MKALQLVGIADLRITDTPLPPVKAHETLLKVSHCALCRTDAKMWKTGHRDLSLPRIPGHEICGFDESTGARFVVWPGRACGMCESCLRGRENLCEQMQILGFHRDGGLAEYAAVPGSSLIQVPEGVPDHLACLAEPLACALNALECTGAVPGHSLLIYGAGPVGLLMALAARAAGMEPHVAEKHPAKLDRSKAFRAAVGIESDAGCMESGFDAAINAAPSFQTIEDGIPRLKAGGVFCLFSGLPDAPSLSSSLLNEIHYRELKVVGAYGCTRNQLARAVQIVAGHSDRLEWLIESIIGLEDVPEALERVLSGQALKFVVRFSS